MTQTYAKDQPSGFTNRIQRVAIVGAGGLVGKYLTEALLKTGKHTITALTRKGSNNELPKSVKPAYIDYDDEATLVSALHDQQFLIITLSVTAAPDVQSKLIQAAAKAGVSYVMPNSFGTDMQNEALTKDMPPTTQAVNTACSEIQATKVSSSIALCCNLWYEYSLVCGPMWFGFDLGEKKVTFYDDGRTKINATTWEQCGRAVASLLSLKILADNEDDHSPTVSHWANKPLYISSFLISQKDMFESIKRVTGTKDEDWTVDYEPSIERRKRGLALLEKGDFSGFGLAMFPRVFYQNGDGDFESKYGLANGALGLPKEDLDERTKVAQDVADSGYSYLTRSF